jgi:cytochrome c553
MKKTILATATVATLLLSGMASADAGKDAYNNFGCAGCHGANGISTMDAYPNLAGQKAAYTVKQLIAFKEGIRVDPTMNAMAAMVVGQEQAIADYLAGL